jgi:integrase
LRPLSVNAITTDDVLAVLKPIWSTKPVVGSCTRECIERVLDVAKVRGLRSGENPARWRGHLNLILPKQKALTEGHFAAMPFAEVGAFMARLRAREGTAARMLEFAILTAARPSEAREAVWSEFDLDSALWTIPEERMKKPDDEHREHRVPLSPPALELIKAMYEIRTGEFVFPGERPGRPLSATVPQMTLFYLKVVNATAHGFRSCFRDWAAETTNYPNYVVEMALAHKVKGVEGAYRRGDLFDKRRQLMNDWAEYCAIVAGSKVLTFGRPTAVATTA